MYEVHHWDVPIYDFRCESCGTTFEELTRAGELPPCPSCGNGEAQSTDDRSAGGCCRQTEFANLLAVGLNQLVQAAEPLLDFLEGLCGFIDDANDELCLDIGHGFKGKTAWNACVVYQQRLPLRS